MKEIYNFMSANVFSFNLIMMGLMLSLFAITGYFSLKRFSDLKGIQFKYSEKFATGFSNKSWLTRHGGAKNCLHIQLTDKELIIKTFLVLAFIARRNDLLHRVPFSKIKSLRLEDAFYRTKLFITFVDEKNRMNEIVLVSKNNQQIKTLLELETNSKK
jgi:hypothetical protein